MPTRLVYIIIIQCMIIR